MGYADRVADKPGCWGDERSCDPDHDPECASCRFQHSCRDEVDRSSRVPPINRYRPNYRPTSFRSDYRDERRSYKSPDDRPLASSHESGMVGEHETAFQRFVKDSAAGGLRGAFYEAYQFFTKFRFR